jgi:uncharacterized integral membrane protein
MQFFLIFALIIAIITVFFAIQNTAMVTVYFFIWQFTSSLALILIFSLVIGVLLSLLISIPKIQSRNWQISKLKKQVSEFTEENAKLKEKVTNQEGQISALQTQLNDFKGSINSPPSGSRSDTISETRKEDDGLFNRKKE